MSKRRQRSRPPDDFFQRVPRRSLLVFFGGVFFLFAPFSLMFVTSFAQQRPAIAVLFYAFLSGSLAVCWAGTFTLSRWFAAGIVLFSLAVMVFSGPLAGTTLGLGFADPSLEGVAVATAITIGYILFMIFIAGQGRTTLRLLTEMDLAQRIHETLVPPLAFGNERLEVLGVSQASSEMGGDLLDLVVHDRVGLVDVFVADVAGHGVGAGVVMGMLKSSIRTGLHGGLALEELARTVNAVLERTTRDEIYATLAALRIHDDGTVAVLLAGHHPVLHWSAAEGKLQRVHEGGAPLGLMADRRYAAHHLRTAPGDLLAAYTDGLNETHDAQERELGHTAIEEAIAAGARAPLAELRRTVFELAERHGPQADDRTLVLVRFR
jgi:hypothetical protein